MSSRKGDVKPIALIQERDDDGLGKCRVSDTWLECGCIWKAKPHKLVEKKRSFKGIIMSFGQSK